MECIEEETNRIIDAEFLETLFEIQERIDDSNSRDEVETIKEQILLKILKLNKDLETTFANENLDKVKDYLKSLKFHLSILQNIENKIFTIKN